jgi:hypothetical protein
MSQKEEQNNLRTTLAVWRPSGQWTTLFQHRSYAAGLWALIFEPNEVLVAKEHFQEDEWSSLSDKISPKQVVGYSTSAGEARERLVSRLGPVRRFDEVWRAFSLTRALALSLAAIPTDWTVRFDASSVIIARNNRYTELMSAAISVATDLAKQPPERDTEAMNSLLAMVHGMNPETPLKAAIDPRMAFLSWSTNAKIVEYELLGKAVECPTDYVDAMTRARYQWQERW